MEHGVGVLGGVVMRSADVAKPVPSGPRFDLIVQSHAQPD
jgi:hypothetical protein